MKCGIITFHRAINYGAVLQAYALRSYIIKNFEVDCDVIDYRAESIESMYAYPHFSLNPKLLIKKMIEAPKRKKFSGFLHERICVGKSVTRDQLAEESKKYDMIITGSDQVWGKSRIGKDHSFFLDFVTDCSKKASYAASMGSGTIGEQDKESYRDMLQNFKYLSVREHEAKLSLEKLLSKHVEESIDPTLLLNREMWGAIAKNKVKSKRYMLVYTLTNSEMLLKLAKQVAAERDLEIYYITDALHSYPGIKNLKGLGPEEWVGAFMNASYIVTNSFHGTAFAINFHIDFNTEVSKGIAQRGARIIDLLKLVSLEKRLVNGNSETGAINFENCERVLEKQRHLSYLYLKQMMR